MELWIIRHAQPAYDDGITQLPDPRLTELGHRQAALLAAHLADAAFDQIWVSHATRARQTAAPLAEATGITPIEHRWLHELDTEAYAGQPKAQVDAKYAQFRKGAPSVWWDGPPGCESMRDFHVRVASGMDAALHTLGATRYPHEEQWLWRDLPSLRIAVVCHGGTHGCLLEHLLGAVASPWPWMRFLMGHAAITQLRTMAVSDGDIFALGSMNHTPHLTDATRTF